MADRIKIIQHYDTLIALHPNVVRKGKNNPYTSLNGHMFSMVTKEGQMAIRLSKEEREKFIQDICDDKVITYNTHMKEYVCIPESMMENPESVLHYLDRSIDYINTLKPKPSKKKG